MFETRVPRARGPLILSLLLRHLGRDREGHPLTRWATFVVVVGDRHSRRAVFVANQYHADAPVWLRAAHVMISPLAVADAQSYSVPTELLHRIAEQFEFVLRAQRRLGRLQWSTRLPAAILPCIGLPSTQLAVDLFSSSSSRSVWVEQHYERIVDHPVLLLLVHPPAKGGSGNRMLSPLASRDAASAHN